MYETEFEYEQVKNLVGKQILTKQGKLRLKNKNGYELMIKSFESLAKYYTQLLHFRETIKDNESHKTITKLIQKTKNALRKYDKEIKEKRDVYEVEKLNREVSEKILSEIYL